MHKVYKYGIHDMYLDLKKKKNKIKVARAKCLTIMIDKVSY